MPIAEARIDTDRPSRYLVQFCKHAAAMGSGRGHQLRMHGDTALGDVSVRADWSDTVGTVTFDPWGQCRLEAGDASLLVRVEAANMDGLQHIEQIVANDLDRFSRQQLTIAWHALDAEPAEKHRITTTEPRMVLRRRPIPWLACSGRGGYRCRALSGWRVCADTLGVAARGCDRGRGHRHARGCRLPRHEGPATATWPSAAPRIDDVALLSCARLYVRGFDDGLQLSRSLP